VTARRVRSAAGCSACPAPSAAARRGRNAHARDQEGAQWKYPFEHTVLHRSDAGRCFNGPMRLLGIRFRFARCVGVAATFHTGTELSSARCPRRYLGRAFFFVH
jgi:hypothetical protein